MLHPCSSQVQSLIERFHDQLSEVSRQHFSSAQSLNLESLYMMLVKTVERVRVLSSGAHPEVAQEAKNAMKLLETL